MIIKTSKGILDYIKVEPIMPDETILDRMRKISKQGTITQKDIEDLARELFTEHPQTKEVKYETLFGTITIRVES